MAINNSIENQIYWNSISIKKLRRFINLSQNEFSNRLGVRQQTISEWETGAYLPRGASVTLLNLVSDECGYAFTNHRNKVNDALGIGNHNLTVNKFRQFSKGNKSHLNSLNIERKVITPQKAKKRTISTNYMNVSSSNNRQPLPI